MAAGALTALSTSASVEVDRIVVVAVDREEKDLVEKDRSPAEDEGKRRSGGEHTRVRGKRRRAPAAMDGG